MLYNSDGTFKKYKARLVARRVMLKNIHNPGTYIWHAGIVHSATLRLFLSVTASLDLDLVSYDIKTAFYPSLKDNEDLSPPTFWCLWWCYTTVSPASKYFDEQLSTSLIKISFTRFISDNQLFLLRQDEDFICPLKHVDDFILTGPNAIHCSNISMRTF
jgi:hypothetical protein